MTAVVAVARDSKGRDVIGLNGKMPWHIPSELKTFKNLTMGGVLVMGRKTFESIGRPLPGRHTVVLSRTATFTETTNLTVIRDINELGKFSEQKIYVCGGAEIYKLLLSYCSTLYISRILKPVEGDTFFEMPKGDFKLDCLDMVNSEFTVERWLRDSYLH